MIDILKNPIYARLFSAQVIALLGMGLFPAALIGFNAVQSGSSIIDEPAGL